MTTPVPALRDPKRAVTLAEKAVAENPYSADFWNTLGVAQYRAGNWKEAISSLERSRELGSGGGKSSNFFLAMAEWQLGHKDAAEDWYQKSITWMEANASTDEEVTRLYVESEKLMGGISSQSLASARQGRWERELADLSRDVEQRPADAEPYHARGIRLCQVGRDGGSIADFDKALKLKPYDHQLWYEAAAIYLYTGDVERYRGAAASCSIGSKSLPRKTLKLPTGPPRCVHSRPTRRQLRTCREIGRACITGTENHGSHRNFMFAKGLAEYRSRREAQALYWLQRCRQTVEIHPWNAGAHATLAMVHHRLGHIDEARTSLDAARAIIARKPADTMKNHNWFDWLHCEILCREAEEILAK